MFTLELDVILTFKPFMVEHGRGITLTRRLELPFAPYEGLAIFGRQLDDCPEPPGFFLKEVVWDIDRQVFLAKTYIIMDDEPLELIPGHLEAWVDRGWNLGSHMDYYRHDEPDEQHEDDEGPTAQEEEEDWNEMLVQPRRRPQQRTPEFNEIFGTLVRTLAELYNNEAAAYAMDKTKQFFTQEQLQRERSIATLKWSEKVREYEAMDLDRQVAWRQRVLRKYPSLADLICGTHRPGQDASPSPG